MSTLVDGTAISITPHPILNTCKCVISSYDTIRYTEAEALEKMASQNVIKVQRITRMENGKRVNTPALILTFSQTTYPEYVKVGLLRIPTRTYYPNPLLCYGCLDYGHGKLRCTAPKRCHNCSGEPHDEDCEAAAFCCNCKGEHRPTSRKCPIYQKEVAVVKLKVDNNLTYKEARKRVEDGQVTYAQATAQSRLDGPKIEALMEECKKKDEIIAKLLADNKKKDDMLTNVLNELKLKTERLEVLGQQVNALQTSVTALSSNVHSGSRDPVVRTQASGRTTTKSDKLKVIKYKFKKEEKNARRSKRLQNASPDGRSPPTKTTKPTTSDTELDPLTENEEVVDISDSETALAHSNQLIQNAYDAYNAM